MCAKCSEIDVLIARYRRLGSGIGDPQTSKSAMDLIAELEARKLDLHRDGREGCLHCGGDLRNLSPMFDPTTGEMIASQQCVSCKRISWPTD